MEKISEIHLLALKEQLVRKGLTVAVAESITVGNIQSVLGSISGASSFFEGGLTVYSLEQKVNILGIDKKYAESVNCVSEIIAKEMAIRVAKLFKSNIGIGTCGYAEIYKGLNITIPNGFYAIWIRKNIGDFSEKTLIQKKVEYPNLKRLDVQHKITCNVITTLLEYIKKNSFNL